MFDTPWLWGGTWRGSPIAAHRGTIEQVMAHVPDFERRDFVAGHGGLGTRGRHPRRDTIVRLPLAGEHEVVPVGVVSKGYVLVPHRQVLAVAAQALTEAGVSVDEVDAAVTLTEYGERMAVSFCLPGRYHVDPGDGHPMALRLECFNAVDGSLRFRALMGWFRFVCRNGLVVGVTMRHVRCRHIFTLPLTGLEAVVRGGLERFHTERAHFALWRDRPVTMAQVERWANTRVKEAWGVKAAVRTCHIARTGHDAEVIGPYGRVPPSRVPTTPGAPVPGSPPRSATLFDLSQVLAWLARERRDVAEQLAWREQTPPRETCPALGLVLVVACSKWGGRPLSLGARRPADFIEAPSGARPSQRWPLTLTTSKASNLTQDEDPAGSQAREVELERSGARRP